MQADTKPPFSLEKAGEARSSQGAAEAGSQPRPSPGIQRASFTRCLPAARAGARLTPPHQPQKATRRPASLLQTFCSLGRKKMRGNTAGDACARARNSKCCLRSEHAQSLQSITHPSARRPDPSPETEVPSGWMPPGLARLGHVLLVLSVSIPCNSSQSYLCNYTLARSRAWFASLQRAHVSPAVPGLCFQMLERA